MIHMLHNPRPHKEAGVVSILTVIFFMIFVSIIAVGFIKIVNDDQTQSTDNDLSASALASAQSGAEDGKRLLVLCRNPSSQQIKDACANSLNNPDCDAVTGNATLVNALDIDIDTSDGRNDGIVSSNDSYQQRYTCMTIRTITDTIEDVLVEKDTSELIPLSSAGDAPFNNVRFSWHATADDRDGPLEASRSNVLLPEEQDWQDIAAKPYAALMRLEIIAYRDGGSGFDLSDIEPSTRTVFLAPGSASTADTPIDINALSRAARNDPNDLGSEHRPYLVRCDGTQTYACSVRLDISGNPNPSNHNYMVRVSSVYRGAYVRTQLFQNNSPVQMDGVQPIIDVTGRANDVFRRVQTRVQFDSPVFMPRYAIETGELCKNMLVTNDSVTSSDYCNPGPPVVGACTESARDIILVMDASNSMINNSYGGLGAQRAVVQRLASRDFVNVMSLTDSGNRLGIVQFHGSIPRRQALTTDKNLLLDATNYAGFAPQTHYRVALDESDSLLSGSGSRSGAEKVIIFMSDGRPNDKGDSNQGQINQTRDHVMAKVNELATNGVRIFSIAVDLNTNGSAVLQEMPRNGSFYDANTAPSLTAHLQTIAAQFVCPAP